METKIPVASQMALVLGAVLAQVAEVDEDQRAGQPEDDEAHDRAAAGAEEHEHEARRANSQTIAKVPKRKRRPPKAATMSIAPRRGLWHQCPRQDSNLRPVA